MSDDTTALRVLIVEDDAVLARLLTLELTHAGFAVTSCDRGEAALPLIEHDDCDCILLDVMLPGMSGLEVLRRTRRDGGPAVILITARGEIPDKVSALDAGADDYLVKPVNLEELAARIRAVLRRREPGTPSGRVLEARDVRLFRDAHRAIVADQELSLTPLEFQLLQHLMLHPNIVQTRAALLNRVWGYSAAVETGVVDVTVSRLRKKLGDARSALAIETVRQVGYTVRLP